jgi:hypothetical protein
LAFVVMSQAHFEQARTAKAVAGKGESSGEREREIEREAFSKVHSNALEFGWG